MVGKDPERNQEDLENILAAIGSGLASATMTFVKDAQQTETESENDPEEQIIKPEPVQMTPTKETPPCDAEEFSQVTFSNDSVQPSPEKSSKATAMETPRAKKPAPKKREQKACWKKEHKIKISMIKS